MAWKTLKRYVRALEKDGDVIRIERPVRVDLEAGCIADLLVKTGGPAVVFEKPELPDGTISEIPLVMNLFGSKERTLRALQAKSDTEIGDRLVSLMKPDIGEFVKRPWKGFPLAKDALALPPKKVRRAKCQEIAMDGVDLTKLPIPKTWPMDGGHYITLPLVVTKNQATEEHNLGMYRAQVHGKKELGLHWQIHKHGAEHASGYPDGKMPVAVCIGGPPELIFSAISPLPDNLEEYMFAGFLGRRRLRIVKALTQDIWVPADADIVIEGYVEPGEMKSEGPFGDHFGFYSLTGQYPVLKVTAVTHRKDAMMPATIVGLPPMEDGFLGEAIGKQFSPVLRFQHRDVMGVHLPMETGFHNLAIVASKQRYPRQARKTALGLFGAGQMMFLKTIVAVDSDQKPDDLELFLDALNDKVDPREDIIVIEGMVGDSLDPATPYENVQSKILIDATTIPDADPRSDSEGPEGSPKRIAPGWRKGKGKPPGVPDGFLQSVLDLESVSDARLLRPSMLVVTTSVDGRPDPRKGMFGLNEELAKEKEKKISQLINSIWQLQNSKTLRWLFITDDDLELNGPKARRRLLWQLFARFDVDRGLRFDIGKSRVAWDATVPIPSMEGDYPIRRWPAVTLHDPEIMERVRSHAEEDGLGSRMWPPHLLI